jgi:hypothetical protein
MIDPNEYYAGATSRGVYSGQTRTILWVEGDWVLYRKLMPSDGDRIEAYMIHDCVGKGMPSETELTPIKDWSNITVGIIGTDLMNSKETECRHCKEEIPDVIQTLYRIYGWGINREVL